MSAFLGTVSLEDHAGGGAPTGPLFSISSGEAIAEVDKSATAPIIVMSCIVKVVFGCWRDVMKLAKIEIDVNESVAKAYLRDSARVLDVDV